MGLFDRQPRVDERVRRNLARPPLISTVRQAAGVGALLLVAAGAFSLVAYVRDGSGSSAAGVLALLAGLSLGRVAEVRAAKRGQGLRDIG